MEKYFPVELNEDLILPSNKWLWSLGIMILC